MTVIQFTGIAPAYNAKQVLDDPALSARDARFARNVKQKLNASLEGIGIMVRSSELKKMLAIKKKQAADNAMNLAG